LAHGRIDLVEINAPIVPGVVFGEIAFFATDHRRRLTARCAEDSIVLSIDESTVKQLFYQNPAFGFKMIELVADRLSADILRLNEQLATERANQLAARADVSD
jgi:CRP-like cAMP-binding protein